MLPVWTFMWLDRIPKHFNMWCTCQFLHLVSFHHVWVAEPLSAVIMLLPQGSLAQVEISDMSLTSITASSSLCPALASMLWFCPHVSYWISGWVPISTNLFFSRRLPKCSQALTQAFLQPVGIKPGFLSFSRSSLLLLPWLTDSRPSMELCLLALPPGFQWRPGGPLWHQRCWYFSVGAEAIRSI